MNDSTVKQFNNSTIQQLNNSTPQTYTRRASSEVTVGGLAMGGKNPVRIQTMTTTATTDVAASVAQCLRVAHAGADYVRLTTQGLRETEALKIIKTGLRAKGCTIPLIADVHFTPTVALAAAAIADKVRINPGNFGASAEEADTHLQQLIAVCKHHRTALRIGVNHGSLSPRITEHYGDTPQGMVASAMELLRTCAAHDFNQVVVSMKSSNTRVMVEAYRLLVASMDAENMRYPLHLGVTEAGDGDDGRLKSAVGIGTLLAQGLGDTIRVSLTEPPENEIPVAQALVHLAPQYPIAANNIQPKTTTPFTLCRDYHAATREELLLRMACDAGARLLDGVADDFKMNVVIGGKPLPDTEAETLSLALLQAARVRFTHPEYIACPGCGRTLFDLPRTLADVRARTAHLKGLKIAVMGCIVNGLGEMADADYGYVGAGHGKVTLYKAKQPVRKNIPQEQAVDELVALLKEEGDWTER
ncbi:MAG: (E)-4-hydroxy-3-methylbut-2-enyl-diphosphate synthase [Prevotellaceae bacterium]|jgi:(E)-4-hydroxy-3-methylbut-2-enyl-diphosphate synthase|nr:(E)-4-hydroxy-3-methylbut-2-enyl-diphosphate synthase [Prevotellaceae bacterium]